MNFLAHLYLSGDNPEIMIGNFIADSVKGSAYKNYSPQIANGILLHRAIDDFTDKHPVFMQSVIRLRPQQGKFSGVVTDIFYDHFLAAAWNSYSDTPLPVYAHQVHALMQKNEHLIPEKSRMFLKYMIQNNWLVLYSTLQGIAKVLQGMSRRARFANKMDSSVLLLEKYYSDFENEFKLFFDDVKKMSDSF